MLVETGSDQRGWSVSESDDVCSRFHLGLSIFDCHVDIEVKELLDKVWIVDQVLHQRCHASHHGSFRYGPLDPSEDREFAFAQPFHLFDGGQAITHSVWTVNIGQGEL